MYIHQTVYSLCCAFPTTAHLFLCCSDLQVTLMMRHHWAPHCSPPPLRKYHLHSKRHRPPHPLLPPSTPASVLTGMMWFMSHVVWSVASDCLMRSIFISLQGHDYNNCKEVWKIHNSTYFCAAEYFFLFTSQSPRLILQSLSGGLRSLSWKPPPLGFGFLLYTNFTLLSLNKILQHFLSDIKYLAGEDE